MITKPIFKLFLKKTVWVIVAAGQLTLFALAIDFDQLEKKLTQKFGFSSLTFFSEWKYQINESRNIQEKDKLKRINDTINRNINYAEDIMIWGIQDYWATPLETIGKNYGDCEDFSIIKYYSLIAAGVPENKLRLVYVKANQSGVLQAHMVLAYYSTPTSEPMILDNINTEILPASKRTDLFPIFSFNNTGVWQGTGNQSNKGSLTKWQELLQRAQNEGFK